MKQESMPDLLVSEAHALCLPQKGFSPKFFPVPFSGGLFASDLRSSIRQAGAGYAIKGPGSEGTGGWRFESRLKGRHSGWKEAVPLLLNYFAKHMLRFC
jgi:hypothetical protein